MSSEEGQESAEPGLAGGLVCAAGAAEAQGFGVHKF